MPTLTERRDTLEMLLGDIDVDEEIDEPWIPQTPQVLMRFPSRHWNRDVALVTNPKAGVVVKSLRAFGLEAEAHYRSGDRVFYPDYTRVYRAKEQIHPGIGLMEDSGCEFQTPPACGIEAEKMIVKLGRVMKNEGFHITHGNGLHVHVDGTDLIKSTDSWKYVRNLWLFYIAFDDVIRKIIPRHRRENGTCRRTEQIFDSVAVCTSQNELDYLWYATHDDDSIQQRKCGIKDHTRYHGFNLHPLLSHGHLEIRYHEGTISALEMLEWANLHCLIMDRIIQGVDVDFLLMASKKKWLKRGMMCDFIGLSEESRAYFNNRARKCA